MGVREKAVRDKVRHGKPDAAPEHDEIRTEADPHAIPPEMDPGDYPSADANGEGPEAGEGDRPASDPPDALATVRGKCGPQEVIPGTNANEPSDQDLFDAYTRTRAAEIEALKHPPPEVAARTKAEDALARRIHRDGGTWDVPGDHFLAGRKPRASADPWYLEKVKKPTAPKKFGPAAS